MVFSMPIMNRENKIRGRSAVRACCANQKQQTTMQNCHAARGPSRCRKTDLFKGRLLTWLFEIGLAGLRLRCWKNHVRNPKVIQAAGTITSGSVGSCWLSPSANTEERRDMRRRTCVWVSTCSEQCPLLQAKSTTQRQTI